MDPIAALSPAWFAVDTSTGGGLENYGIAGTVAAIFLAGIVWVARQYLNDLRQQRDSANARANQAEAELRTAITTYAEKVIGIQTTATEAVSHANELVATVIRELPHRGSR